MLDLLLFCPAERVIRAEDQTVSLITLIEDITVRVPPELGPPPEGAMTPFGWAAFTMWSRRDAKREASFEQRVTVVRQEQELIRSDLPFVLPVGITKMKTTQPVFGFPIWYTGPIEIVLSLRESGADEWTERARFPLAVIHQYE